MTRGTNEKNKQLVNLESEGYFELGTRSIPGSLGQIALIVVFATFSGYTHAHPLQVAVLGSIILASNFLRLYLGVNQHGYFPDRKNLWFSLFSPTIWMPGLCWGILFFFVILKEGIASYATIISCLIGSGISASIVTSVSPSRRLSFAFTTPVIGLPLIALLLEPKPKALGLALIFVIYYVFLALHTNIHYKSTWSSVANKLKLIEQRNRLQTVVDAIPCMVSWVDRDLKYRGVNRGFAQNYSGNVEEFLGKDLSYKIPDNELIEAVRRFATSQDTRQATLEMRLTTPNRPRWHLVVMRRSDPEEIYIVCFEIHEFKEVQSELEQQKARAELISKLAALGEITANMAHEIRNPLNVVINSTELIQKEVTSHRMDSEKLIRLTERVLATCLRINRIIDNLRAFARKSEGEPFSKADLNHIVRDSIDLIEHHFRANRVALIAEALDHAIFIMGNPVEISQVLVNLLNNALDAAKKQNDKWVRLKILEDSDKGIIVSITDSGHGIPDEIADKLFTPFFTTKSKDAGTGLGLSISKRIIERHGGALELDRSAENTTFVISLPRALRAAA